MEEEEAGRLFNQRNIREVDKSKRPTSAPITSAPINNDKAVRRKSFSAADTKQSPLTEDQVSSVDTGDDSATEVVSDLKYDSSEEESSDDDSATEVVSVSESSDDESDISEQGQSDSEEEEEAGQQQPQPQQGEPVEIKFFEGDKPNEGYAIFRGVKSSQQGGVDYESLEDKYSLANQVENHMYPRDAIPEYPYGSYYYVAFFHNPNTDDVNSDIFSNNIPQKTRLFFRCIGAFPNLHFATIAVQILLNYPPIPKATKHLFTEPLDFFHNILRISNIPEYTTTGFLDSHFFINESNFDLLYMLHSRKQLKLRFKNNDERSDEYNIDLTIGIGESETTERKPRYYYNKEIINSIKENMVNSRNMQGDYHATHIKITITDRRQNNIPTDKIKGGTTEYSDGDDDGDGDDDVFDDDDF